VLAEILDERVASSRNRRNQRGVKRKMSTIHGVKFALQVTGRNQRGVKRKMSNFPLRRGYNRSAPLDICSAIRIVK
jgi:hypothetical protein